MSLRTYKRSSEDSTDVKTGNVSGQLLRRAACLAAACSILVGCTSDPPPVAVPESSSPSPSLPPAPTCVQISDAVADAYLVDWSLSPDSTPDDDQADSSCRVEGELRAAPDTVGIMIIIVRRSDGFAINGTSPNEEAKQGAKASMEAPCVPASPHEVAGPYYFAATCSRMAKRPARSVTVLVEDGNAVHVSAMIDRPVDDVELQRVLEEASTGTADAVLRLM